MFFRVAADCRCLSSAVVTDGADVALVAGNLKRILRNQGV